MEDLIFVRVTQDHYVYEKFTITRNCVTKYNSHGYDVASQKPSKQKVKLLVDGILLYYFVQELRIAFAYRNLFMDKFYTDRNKNVNAIKVILTPANREIIDYNWNYRTTYLVRERCELEHTLSWLSTLGGAFSALGDYFVNYAEIAGKISVNQLQLAMRLGDPNVVSRCLLYLSLSLIQRNNFKLAKRIVYSEYIKARNATVVDIRLINMCKGIWCKFKYEYGIYKKCKRNLNKI